MKPRRQAVISAFTLISLMGCATGSPAPTPGRSPSPAMSVAPTATSQPTLALPSASFSPSESPPTPVPSPVSGVPDELQFRWIGPVRDVPQITPKVNFSGLEMAAHTTWFYAYTQGDGTDLRSTTSSPAANELSFVTVEEDAGCHLNDMGTYTYTLDAAKTGLTLTTVSDPCEARSAAFSGHWTRSACPDQLGWCLGPLGAGDYQSAVFTPFTPQASWAYDFGEMSYTVPSGWTNPEDTPGGYKIQQLGASEFTAIYLFADVLAHLQATDCSELPDMTVGSSAADLTNYLTSLPSVVTTDPAAVTVGGLSGSMLDVSVAPNWTQTCPYSEGKPAAQVFSNDDPRHEFDWGLVGDGRMRLFVLALPNDRTLLIDIESTDKQTWEALLPAAMPVVNSFSFGQ